MADFLFEERIFEELLVSPGYFGILYRILGYLDFQSLLRCQQVSKSFKQSILSSQQFWILQKRFFDKQLGLFHLFDGIDFYYVLDSRSRKRVIQTLCSSNTLQEAIQRWLKCNEQVLPKYWEARTTPDGQLYYINKKTRSVQWLHPLPFEVRLPLPPDWEIRQTKQKYFLFVNATKGLCSWKHPSQIKQNERTDQLVNYGTDNSHNTLEAADGTFCFYGEESVRKWYHPGLIKAMQASLPDGWEVKLDSNGLIFYVNHTDLYSTWYHPSENPKLEHLQSSKLRIRPFFKSKMDDWLLRPKKASKVILKTRPQTVPGVIFRLRGQI